MIYLHQYPPVWGLPSLSPFCIKVETYLRMINLPYQTIIEINPRKGPKGKMPVLRDGDKIISDSSFIIEYLQNKYSISLDANLSSADKAIAYAIRKMIEENLYFVLLYSRWIDPVGKKIVDGEFKKFFPKYIAKIALRWIRRNLQKQAYYQGIGRHTRDEVYALGCQDIAVLSQLLGTDQLFFLEDKPHTIDATIYAFLSTLLHSPLVNPLTSYIRQHQNLIGYCENMKKLYFNEGHI